MTGPKSDDFLKATRECDLVMKGGITSGVVYPPLVLELARQYRFVHVGGTSAGAIAAGFTAAAEYGRVSGGFVRLAAVPGILQEHLLDLFQPHPKHHKTFRGLVKLLLRDKRPSLGFVTIVRYLPLMRHVYRSYRKLPKTYYGLCPGTTQERSLFGRAHPGLTDWLNVQLEWLAGRIESEKDSLPEKPLTFGDLAERGVVLRTLSTDISSKNPVLLPFQNRNWMYREDELPKLLPKNVGAWLRTQGEAVEGSRKFRRLPKAHDLPVLLGVRASMSFPVLFAALPFYRIDWSLRFDNPKKKGAKTAPQRCWLSDGGISSNFPIHLFDDPLPARPTFGISLDRFDRRRHSQNSNDPKGRVWLPRTSREGTQRPIDRIGSPFSFVGAIFNAARNWQDELQSVLPGYRERIAHIALTSKEGGLNLNMSADVVGNLLNYGQIAGQLLDDFDLAEHQWRRLLTLYAALEETLESIAQSWDEGLIAEIAAYEPKSYRPDSRAQKQELLERMDSLVKLGHGWGVCPLRDRWARGNGMPRPRTHLKQVPYEQAAGVAEETVD